MQAVMLSERQKPHSAILAFPSYLPMDAWSHHRASLSDYALAARWKKAYDTDQWVHLPNSFLGFTTH